MNELHTSPPSYWRSVIYGALINNVISVVPYLNFLNALTGIGLVLAGGFATYHHVRTHEVYPTLGFCFQIGAFAGLFGCAIWLIYSLIFGTTVIALFRTIFIAIAIGGVSGMISGSVIRRKYISRKQE